MIGLSSKRLSLTAVWGEGGGREPSGEATKVVQVRRAGGWKEEGAERGNKKLPDSGCIFESAADQLS